MIDNKHALLVQERLIEATLDCFLNDEHLCFIPTESALWDNLDPSEGGADSLSVIPKE